MNVEYVKRIAAFIGAVAGMFAVTGCCNTQGNCKTPPPRQAAYASKYSLGSGTSANTSAARLVAQRNPPCVSSCDWRILSTPAGRRTAPKVPDRRPCESPAAMPAPVVTQPAPGPVAVSSVGCATGAYDGIIPGGACEPNGNLGACYTLSDEELASGPTVYVPNAGALEVFTTLSASGDDFIPAPPESAPEEVTPVVEPPVDTTSVPASPVTAPIVEPAAIEPLAPPAGTASARASTETADAPAAEMPPVFRRGATEAAAEEVLSRIGKVESIDALSPVELPPDL